MGEAKAKPRAWSRRRERYKAAMEEIGSFFEGKIRGMADREKKKEKKENRRCLYIHIKP